jgi:DNA-binding FadR family transcriptional regulator
MLLHRPRAAELIFDALAADIFEGRYPAGEPLPSEGELAGRFGVSRMIMRQALHRLAQLDLITVRQGGVTRVNDARASGDLRHLELLYRLAPDRTLLDPADVLEKQLLQGLCLIDVAVRRASKKTLSRIADLVDAFARSQSEERFIAFEERFWTAVAEAGGNRIFQMETSFWCRVLADRPRPEHEVASPLALRVAFYVQLAARLRARSGASQFYLEALSPLLSALTRRRKK